MPQAANEDDLDIRRKRLIYRANHRGIKEMDILIGGFANAALGKLTADELSQFEILLEVPDQDLYAMIVSDAPVPPALDHAVMRAIIAYSRQRPAP